MNTANVAWHKMFWEKPSFVDKKLDEKTSKQTNKQTNKQFGELSTEETQEITDNAISVTTKSIKVRNSNIQRYVPVKCPLKAKLNFKH